MGVVNAALELTGGTLAKEEKLMFSCFGTFCLFCGKGPYPIASKGIGANAILSTGGNIAMKRFAVAVVFVVLLAMAASGAVQDFGEFTLDIPKGWTVKENKPAEESLLYTDLSQLPTRFSGEPTFFPLPRDCTSQDLPHIPREFRDTPLSPFHSLYVPTTTGAQYRTR